ncbi:unnamed protein product [Nezara viridula]|uniref:Uncharacterized protein n=1 Tax=Nezara viridula TaxID=85310 RepID=A0A9P0HJM6_NEZVI|nr:unnamed protein product [Nezara viridula]
MQPRSFLTAARPRELTGESAGYLGGPPWQRSRTGDKGCVSYTTCAWLRCVGPAVAVNSGTGFDSSVVAAVIWYIETRTAVRGIPNRRSGLRIWSQTQDLDLTLGIAERCILCRIISKVTQWFRYRYFRLLPPWSRDRLHRRRRATNQPAVVLSYRTIGTVNNRYGVKWRNVTYSTCRGASSSDDVFSGVMAVSTTSFSATPGIIVIGAVALKYICGLLFGTSAFALPSA